MTTTAPPPRVAGSDFSVLNKRVVAAGLLQRRPRYYVLRFTVVTAMLAGVWTAFALLGPSWWQLVVAAFMAVTFAQIALVAHDLAHRQVFRTKQPSERIGLVAGNLAVGMSYGWWMDKHTRHHNNPNHEELDPDVTPEVLVWSTAQAAQRRGLGALVTRHQAWLFFPLLSLLGLDLRMSSVKALVRGEVKRRTLESVLLVLHAAGYLTALLLVLTPGQALAFFAVHQGLFGVYLGCTFAPNHKGMPMPGPGEEWDYLRKQVLTSRNVTGGRVVDVALGGLNYQIEHHLFPAMPTPNLRRARPIVRAYCAEIGVPYLETGLVASYRQVLAHLHAVGAALRA